MSDKIQRPHPVPNCLEVGRNRRFCKGAEEAAARIIELESRLDSVTKERDAHLSVAITVRAMLDAAENGWRCFMCQQVFTDPAAAKQHFGQEGPQCLMNLEAFRERDVRIARLEEERSTLSSRLGTVRHWCEQCGSDDAKAILEILDGKWSLAENKQVEWIGAARYVPPSAACPKCGLVVSIEQLHVCAPAVERQKS